MERKTKRDKAFILKVRSYYKKHGRHDLPWRPNSKGSVNTFAYKVLVSEFMLQQTQVSRVLPKFISWIARYRDIQSLSRASLPDILRLWQGLGYNRRAKALFLLAKDIAKKQGSIPKEKELLLTLPGIGEYTAEAIRAFAFNQDAVLIETNIRTAIIDHFFPKSKKVSDTAIRTILIRLLPKRDIRGWYYALMDYGAHLKGKGISHNTKSTLYQKQTPFKGSFRQVRGEVLRVYLQKGKKQRDMLKKAITLYGKEKVNEAKKILLKEKLI